MKRYIVALSELQMQDRLLLMKWNESHLSEILIGRTVRLVVNEALLLKGTDLRGQSAEVRFRFRIQLP